jgi:hypothetical protein
MPARTGGRRGLAPVLALSLSGCALIAGLGGDYSAPAGDDASAEGDGQAPSDGTVEQGPGETSGPEPSTEDGPGALDVTAGDGPLPDGCATQEICNDGVDNNCDGLVDCADPQCGSMGFTCTAGPVPSGWTVAAFDATGRVACVGPYGPAQDVISNPVGGAPTCNCACSGTSASCGGTVTVFDMDPACTGGTTLGAFNIADGSCQSTSAAFSAAHGYTYTPTEVVTQGACTGTPNVGSQPGVSFKAGESCALTGRLGGGCAGGNSCAPPVGPSFALCITHPGDVACPAAFTTATIVSTGNPGYVDTRSCGACTCATNAGCAQPFNLEFFTSPSCSTMVTFPVVNPCSSPSSSFTAMSYQLSIRFTGDPTCQVQSASMPTGGVVLDSNLMTVCCP